MVKLQRPKYAYARGGLVPWDEAVLHIGCEAITRGLNVFEGLKGYWREDGSLRTEYEFTYYFEVDFEG